MAKIDKKSLFAELNRDYHKKHRKSEAIFKEASRYLVKGGSHNLRLFEPYPFYDVRSNGSKVTDADGNVYIDFWQGHFANILGHNPPVVLDALADYFQKGQGLTTGFPGDLQRELARIILKQLGAEKIRFTTSGTLASMYAVMLSMAFTRRNLAMKAGGGWHGAHPYLLKGITTYRNGLNLKESAGLPDGASSVTVVTRFNNVQDLEEKFKKYGERLACFIVEPFVGAGGFIFGQKGYLQRARELTRKYGALLIFDEVVSGFRFHPGGVQSLYGIRPDLSVLGKAIGGGMPVSAVAGEEEVMALCHPDAGPESKVKFEGGTFCAHPSSMLAGITFLNYLIEHEKDIYPKIGGMGENVRNGAEEIFGAQGFQVRCTGYPDSGIRSSSCVGIHFMNQEVDRIESPEQVWNPEVNDFELREKIFKLAMLQEGINVFHGYGAISAAHSSADIQASLDAMEKIAKKWKKYRKARA
jgi:glutamate-1-semialdehyde 2,1-aminomutase